MARAHPLSHLVQHEFVFATPGRGLLEVTGEVRRLVNESAFRVGVAHVYTHHTSCSLLINENADPSVRSDLERYFARLAPDGDPGFEHVAEGPDDMSAHVRTALTSVNLSVPITAGRLALGTWQGIYLWEHRQAPQRRKITVTLMGSVADA